MSTETALKQKDAPIRGVNLSKLSLAIKKELKLMITKDWHDTTQLYVLLMKVEKLKGVIEVVIKKPELIPSLKITK